jgi:hypothetical protein
MAAQSTTISAHHLVSRAGPAECRPPAQDDDRGTGAKATGRALEIWDHRCRHRRRHDEGRLTNTPNRIPSSSRTWISPGGSRWTNRSKPWPKTPLSRMVLVFLSPCPQAGWWCSRHERRPYVRLIVLGNGPCHCKRGLDLGYRKQLEVSQCCTCRMNIPQRVQAENLRVQDGRIALGDEVSALTQPVVARRRGRPPPKAAAEQVNSNASRNGDQGQCREAANQTASTR